MQSLQAAPSLESSLSCRPRFIQKDVQGLALSSSVLSHQLNRECDGLSSPWAVLHIYFSSSHFLFKAESLQQICPEDQQILWGNSREMRGRVRKALLRPDSWVNPYKGLKKDSSLGVFFKNNLWPTSAPKARNNVHELQKQTSGIAVCCEFKAWAIQHLSQDTAPGKGSSFRERRGKLRVYKLSWVQSKKGIRYFLFWKSHPKGVTGAVGLFQTLLDNARAAGEEKGKELLWQRRSLAP